MSASLQAASALRGAPGRLPETGTHPRIQVIPGHKIKVRRAAWPYIVLVIVLVVLTVALPMVINTQMAQRAYEIRDQQIALSELNAQADSLSSQLLAMKSPGVLEEKAKALGLVPSGHIGAISLEAGTVSGGVAAQ